MCSPPWYSQFDFFPKTIYDRQAHPSGPDIVGENVTLRCTLHTCRISKVSVSFSYLTWLQYKVFFFNTLVYCISFQFPFLFILQDSSSALTSFETIACAVDRLTSDEDLVADGSRVYSLPSIPGKHKDLKTVSPDTVEDVVNGCYGDKLGEVTIIDCRYPYEYEGGHIKVR